MHSDFTFTEISSTDQEEVLAASKELVAMSPFGMLCTPDYNGVKPVHFGDTITSEVKDDINKFCTEISKR